MAVDYSSMTDEQIAIINEYCENDMKKLIDSISKIASIIPGL